jgi:hypothetical protein
LGFCDKGEPLDIEKAATGHVPACQAAAQLGDPGYRRAEAYRSEAPAHNRLGQPLGQEVLAREIDGRLGSASRRIKLASQVVRTAAKFRAKARLFACASRWPRSRPTSIMLLANTSRP